MLSRLPTQLCPLCSHTHPTHTHTPTPAPHLSYLLLPCSATGIRTSILRSSQPLLVPAPFPTLAEVVAVCICTTTRTRLDVQFCTKESINSLSIQLASALVVVYTIILPLCSGPQRRAEPAAPVQSPKTPEQTRSYFCDPKSRQRNWTTPLHALLLAPAPASSRAAPVLCFCALELLCYPLPVTSCPLSVVRSPPPKRQHSATAQLA